MSSQMAFAIFEGGLLGTGVSLWFWVLYMALKTFHTFDIVRALLGG